MEFNPLEKGYQSRGEYFHIKEETLEEVGWLIADIEGPFTLTSLFAKLGKPGVMNRQDEGSSKKFLMQQCMP